MKLIHKILKKMHDNYAVFFQGADALAIQKLSVGLIKAGFAKIPPEYAAFLQETDGLFYNGLELYGVTPHERNRGAFFHTSLQAAANANQHNPVLKGRLIIGNAPEMTIIFNPQTAQYELLNRYTYETLLQLPRFFDLLYYFCPDKNKSSDTK